MLQSEKFDKNAVYIKKWIPELKNVKSSDIHNWYTNHNNYSDINYPKPIVDYKKARKESLQMYKNVLKNDF